MSEQAEEIIENNPSVDGGQQEGFSGILTDALKGEGGQPTSDQPTEEQQTEQTQAEQLFAELVYGEQKIPFKNEEEFQKFLDSNKPLKDGFMRTQDYTRKTQELSRMKKEFEQQAEVWGEVKPNEASMQGLTSIWQAFQKGSPEFQTALMRLAEDASLIVQGQAPKHVAGLASGKDPSFNIAAAPEIQELKQKVSQFENYFEQQNQEKATNEWNSFRVGKEKTGVQFTDELVGTIAHFLQFSDPKTQKPMSLDRAYDYAIRELGLEKTDAVKKVFQQSGDLKKKSPAPVNSNIPSTIKPDAKGFGQILKQGLESQ